MTAEIDRFINATLVLYLLVLHQPPLLYDRNVSHLEVKSIVEQLTDRITIQMIQTELNKFVQ